MKTVTRAFWWLYFALLLSLLLFSVYQSVRSMEGQGVGPSSLAIGVAAINAWGLVGLWGYLRSTRIANRATWIACFLVTLFQVGLGVFAFVMALVRFGASGAEGTVSVLGLIGGLLVGGPLVFGLWRYAYFSGAIWQHR